MARDYIRLRATSERELLLERAKERFRNDEDAATIDEALRKGIAFEELSDQLRSDARDQLKQYDMTDFRFSVTTGLEER